MNSVRPNERYMREDVIKENKQHFKMSKNRKNKTLKLLWNEISVNIINVLHSTKL